MDYTRREEAEQEYIEPTTEEFWVTATFEDYSEEHIGEVTLDAMAEASNGKMPIEIEINGYTYTREDQR